MHAKSALYLEINSTASSPTIAYLWRTVRQPVRSFEANLLRLKHVNIAGCDYKIFVLV